MYRYESNARRLEILQFEHESASGRIDVYEDGTGKVSQILSRIRGVGHASALLKTMVDYADEYDLYLYLQVQRYGPPRKALSNAQLIEFYQRYGFEITRRLRSLTEMERHPNKGEK